jgi:putative zinc finger/helix-turn-helix YgiT family protein
MAIVFCCLKFSRDDEMRSNSMAEVCSNCGLEASITRDDYSFHECGIEDVVLTGIELIRCENCGNVDPVILRIADVQKTIALAVAGKPAKLAGHEIRFLRKYLGMTGDQFSKLLQVDKTTLSKWENDADAVGPQSDRLIRAIALSLGEGLQEHAKEVVKTFAQIAQDSHKMLLAVNAETSEYEYLAARLHESVVPAESRPLDSIR